MAGHYTEKQSALSSQHSARANLPTSFTTEQCGTEGIPIVNPGNFGNPGNHFWLIADC
jgi:hypothetical protein